MLLESELVIAEVGRVRGHFFLKSPVLNLVNVFVRKGKPILLSKVFKIEITLKKASVVK